MITHEKISVVVPIYNNALILKSSYERLRNYLQKEMPDYEIIYVNDASEDNSLEEITSITMNDARVKLVNLKQNHGQQLALSFGLQASSGNIIFTIDADLPTILEDFSLMIEKLHAGYDLVLGRRAGRKNNKVYRSIGAALCNFLIKILFRFSLHDFGCSTAAASKSLVDRFKQSTLSHKVIKLTMLSLSENYCEIDLRTAPLLKNKSTYTFFKLVRLFFLILSFRTNRK